MSTNAGISKHKLKPPRPALKFGEQAFDCIPVSNYCDSFKFILGLFACRGTVTLRALPPMSMAVLWGFLIKGWWTRYPFTVPTALWTPLFTVTVFLGVFRTNQAYQEYKSGPRLLGQVVHSLNCAVRLASTMASSGGATDINISRLVTMANTMMAMVRLDLEPPRGRVKKSGTKVDPAQWVNSDHHGSPPLRDLLTSNDIILYANHSSRGRVMLSSTLLIREFAKNAKIPHAAKWFTDHVEKATQAWRGCGTIRDSDMPFSFGHLYHLMLFVTFVFGTPIAIMCNDSVGWWGLGLVPIPAFLTYALEIMSDDMENPFGWDTNDHDLSVFCHQLNMDTKILLPKKQSEEVKEESTGGVRDFN